VSGPIPYTPYPLPCPRTSLRRWILERPLRIRRRLRYRTRILRDLLLQVGNRCVELRILTVDRRVRQIVDHDIGDHTLLLDQPLPLGSVNAAHRRAGDAAIGERIVAAQPDLAAPRANA